MRLFLSILFLNLLLLFSCDRQEPKPVHQHVSYTRLFNKSAQGKDTLSTLYFPNAFTPNGEGVNDVFRVTATGLAPHTFSLTIFDMNGQSVFETQTPEEGWDGEDQKVGTYEVLLRAEDTTGYEYDHEGLITLVR